jgi:predicted dehydrogenase
VEPIRIAIAGCGYGAKVALPVYARMEGFEPVAVWSRSATKARSVAESAGLELGTDDLQELLSLPGLEAVHVATPVASHVDVAVAAAERGLHVLCEKPLADSLEDARKIVAAIERAGVIGVVNYSRSYQAARRRLLELVREVVGRPRMVAISSVHTDHADPDSRPFTWVHDATLGGGRLQGYGVHDLDLLLQMFEVETVAAVTEIGVEQRRSADGELRPVTAEDAFAVLARLTGGGLAVLSFVATARHPRGDVIEVHGEAGTVRLDEHQAVWWARKGEDLRREGPLPSSSEEAFAAVAQRFRLAVRAGAPPEPSLAHGLVVQALFDAVRSAAAEGRWIQPEVP